jgi:pyruvate kinase
MTVFFRGCGMMRRMLKTQPRRAKIVCTLGPASSTPEMIGALIEAGMNVARLNMSHGSHDDHTRSFETIREQAAAQGVAVAVLADLQGPKIRVGKIPAPGFDLKAGEELHPHASTRTAVIEPGRVTVDYPALARECKPDDRILMDDGNFELRVLHCEGPEVHTVVITGGRLTSRKGVNLPGVQLSLPSLTEKDREDLIFALELGVDTVALSFVRRASDVAEVRALMEAHGRVVPIIAKIEKPEGVANLKSRSSRWPTGSWWRAATSGWRWGPRRCRSSRSGRSSWRTGRASWSSRRRRCWTR